MTRIQSTQLQVQGLPVADSLPFLCNRSVQLPSECGVEMVVSVFLQGGHGGTEGHGGGLAQKPNHITMMKEIYYKPGHAMEIKPTQTIGIGIGRSPACFLGDVPVRTSLLLRLRAQQMLSGGSQSSSGLGKLLKDVSRC